jgi:ornithine carbamoyltransferase
MVRDFLSVDDLSPEELFLLLDLAAKVKAQPGDYAARMAGRSVAMIFEKPSTRTRVSFEISAFSQICCERKHTCAW